MLEMPVSILATMMFAGIAVSTVSALIAIPRIGTQQSLVVEMRDEVEAKAKSITDLHQQIEASTTTIVGLRDLLAKAESALTEARGQIYMRDMKLAAAQRVVDGFRNQSAQRNTGRARPAPQEQPELHSD